MRAVLRVPGALLLLLLALGGSACATLSPEQQARTAALADPEGQSLAKTLAGFAATQPPLPQAAE